MGFTAKLIATAELVKDGEAQQVKVDDKVDVKFATPIGEVEVSGKVIGIQLGAVRPSSNQYGPLFDGIATSVYNADKLGNFRDATCHYAPDALLVEEESDDEDAATSNVYVPITKIVEISVTPANEEEEPQDGGEEEPIPEPEPEP